MGRIISDEEMAALERKKTVISDEQMAQLEANTQKPGQIEAGLRGLGQGASLGYSDEITGAIEHLLTGKPYEQARNESRIANESARKENPWTYGAGEVTGGIGSTLAAPVAGGLRGAVGLGTLAGYGLSNKSGNDAAKEALLGGAVGGITHGVLSNVGNIAKKGLRTFTGVPEQTTERYLQNKAAVTGAQDIGEIAKTLPDRLSGISEQIPELSDIAASKLSADRASKGIPAQKVIDELDGILKQSSDPSKLGVIQNKINELVESARQRISTSGMSYSPGAENISEQEMKGVIRALQDAGDWKSPIPTSDSSAINSASGKLNAILKNGNPEYAVAVREQADKIGLKNSLIKKFGLERVPGVGYQETDRTSSALMQLAKAGKIDKQRIADELAKAGGGNLSEDVMNSLAKASLNKGFPAGSRNVNLWSRMGNAVSSSNNALGAVGGVVGATVDTYGPKIGGKLLDAAVVVKQLSQLPGANRFIPMIQKAASRGADSLAATHFLMLQSEPEYRNAVQGEVQ